MMTQEQSLGPRKQSVVGIRISTTSYGEVVAVCREWIRQHREQLPEQKSAARYICVTSVHGIVTAVKKPQFRAVLNGADIATPDGMPVVWALRSFGVANQPRVYGPDLMLALCRDAAACGHRIFLYGATEETLVKLSSRLRRLFPELSIVGTFSPPFRALTEAEELETMRMLQDSKADIVFIGLSTPKQDFWMARYAPRLPGMILAGVGAAFDFHAGVLRQAPGWMQKRGLEWLFRLVMEPARLWRRYLLETPVFLPLWAMQKLGILKYE